MKHLITPILTACMAISGIAVAQQNTPTVQPQLPPQSTTDCTPKPPSDIARHIHFHLPPAVQRALDKQRVQLAQRTGIELAPISPDDLMKGVAKPCKPVPAAPPAVPKN